MIQFELNICSLIKVNAALCQNPTWMQESKIAFKLHTCIPDKSTKSFRSIDLDLLTLKVKGQSHGPWLFINLFPICLKIKYTTVCYKTFF